jgi:hypothetical protein
MLWEAATCTATHRSDKHTVVAGLVFLPGRLCFNLWLPPICSAGAGAMSDTATSCLVFPQPTLPSESSSGSCSSSQRSDMPWLTVSTCAVLFLWLMLKEHRGTH